MLRRQSFTILFIFLISMTLVACLSNEDQSEAKKSTHVEKSEEVERTHDMYGRPLKPLGTCKTQCEEVDHLICTKLVKSESHCRSAKNEKSCDGFIGAFTHALQTQVNCTNTCSEKPFQQALSFRCDELEDGYPKVTERSAHLLSNLQFKSAVKLFTSVDFEKILDGALAEDLRELVLKAKQENNQ